MTEARSTSAAEGAGSGRRLAIAAAVGAVGIALGVGLPAATPPPDRPAPLHRTEPRLVDILKATIENRGIDAAVAQYRDLRERGFPGVQESEADTNRLGYRLLGADKTDTAIEIFRLNAETHPASANVHDSLGEAYLAAGQTALAIASYERAVAINPAKKSAVAELERLTGTRRRRYAPILLFHILAGSVGILSGAVAASLRKGSRRHALAGRVFTVSMLGMAASGAYRAFADPQGETVNVLMGLFTFYLVATAWRTGRRRQGGTDAFDWAALLMVAAVGTGLMRLGTVDARFAAVAFVFGAVALLAAALDVRMILRNGLLGADRLARHLWRMFAALYIAAMSFFLGQPQFFPRAIRQSGLLAVPGILIVVLLVFWVVRVLFTSRYKRAAPPQARLAVGRPA